MGPTLFWYVLQLGQLSHPAIVVSKYNTEAPAFQILIWEQKQNPPPLGMIIDLFNSEL